MIFPMNKIIIHGYDGPPEIEFSDMMPKPERGYPGGKNYIFFGIPKETWKLILHIVNQNIKFDGELLYNGQNYTIIGCSYIYYDPNRPAEVELNILSLI